MQKQTQEIASTSIQHLFHSFYNALKIKKLVAKVPQYSYGYTSETNNKSVNSMYLPQPTKINRSYSRQIQQDFRPKPMKYDTQANFRVDLNKTRISSTYRGVNSRKSTGRRTTGRVSKRQQPQIVNIEKYKIVPPNENNHIIQLEKQKDDTIDKQIKGVRRDMCKRRKQQKQLEQEKQRMLQNERNRKKPVLPRNKQTYFTYTYNGDFVFQPRKDRNHFQISEMNSSVDLKKNQKVVQMEKVKKRRQEIKQDTQQANYRYKKLNLFNNQNNRQISHFPFMHMNDNVIMHQNDLVNQGNSKQRVTLKSFKQSNRHKSFRLFNEISQISHPKTQSLDKIGEKKQEQTFQKTIKRNQNMTPQYKEITPKSSKIMTPQYKEMSPKKSSNDISTQSKEMSPKKSFNFDRINLPQQNLIHRFYKHNFSWDRRILESKCSPRVLNS